VTLTWLEARATMPPMAGRNRWALLSGLDIGADGDPYLDRLRIIQTPLFGVYLHHIHRPDRDPDPHDHPWWFASLVLTGSYEETVWPDKRGPRGEYRLRSRHPWSLRHVARRSAHIITNVRGPLWTLVLTGPSRGEWGFWTQRGYVPWRQYAAGAWIRDYAARKDDTDG
jgi:hypothetical protein